jgi:pyruvate/2-oxoacid:ferredoxin oxidoreductase alpha subunit
MLVYKNDLIRNFIVAITISETKMMIHEQNFDMHAYSNSSNQNYMLAEYVAEYIRRLDAEAKLQFRLIAYYRNFEVPKISRSYLDRLYICI